MDARRLLDIALFIDGELELADEFLRHQVFLQEVHDADDTEGEGATHDQGHQHEGDDDPPLQWLFLGREHQLKVSVLMLDWLRQRPAGLGRVVGWYRTW
ncbi:hypothetical protein FQZ97_763240 [compost metagenome]